MSYQTFLQARNQSDLHNLDAVASLAISLRLGIPFAEAEQLNKADQELADAVVTNRTERLAFYSNSTNSN